MLQPQLSLWASPLPWQGHRPENRKDMYIYGSKGYIYQKTSEDMTVKSGGTSREYYLKAAVRGEIEVKPFDLASLENNMIVMEILDAAVKSAKTGTSQGKSR